MVKNIYCTIKYTCCSLMMSMAVTVGVAQEKIADRLNTPAALENMKMRGLWSQSKNAAGALLDYSFRYASADLEYRFYDGNFRRPQQGESGNNVVFDTEGGGKVKDFFAWGSFNYSRDKVKEANFNSSIIDPYRGMPYYTADTNVSNWNNQHYRLKMRVATPQFWNFLSFGLDGYYQNSVGAKQRDMRTKSVFYTIIVRPGVVLSAGKNHRFGLDFEYASVREDLEMKAVNSYVEQTYYLLSGLGMATETSGIQRFLTYNGNQVGGGLQYNYAGRMNILLDLGYSKKVEDAITTPTSPRYLGTTKDGLWSGKLMAYIPDAKKNTHFVEMNWQERKIDGIEYLQKWETDGEEGEYKVYYKSIRSTYKTQTMSLDYRYVINRGMEYSWKLGAGVKYWKQEERYLIPVSTRDIENTRFEVNVKKNFFLSDNNLRRLLVGVNLGYNKNNKADYVYGGNYPDYRVVTDLMGGDTRYLGADYGDLHLSAVYSQLVNTRTTANLFAKVDWQYLKTHSYDFDHRMVMSVSGGGLC